jgi:hypothetical protein
LLRQQGYTPSKQEKRNASRRTGLVEQAAVEQIERQCRGVLLPGIELLFDDEELAGCTVSAVLTDPERFEGATLADPLEGVEYGRCMARIMRRADGSVFIHSFAHGHALYELKLDAAAVRAAMAAASDQDVVKTFVKLAIQADLSSEEIEALRNEAAKRSGVGKRTIAKMLQTALRELAAERRREARERAFAEHNDPRPRVDVPDADAPWLPQMEILNEVIAASSASHPTTRDIEGHVAFTGKIAVPNMHAFADANPREGIQTTLTSLPAPEQWVIKRMSVEECAEMIERHIDFVDKDSDRSVHLPTPFVKHYLKRDDGALPTIIAVSTLPLVFADGGVWAEDKFDRLRGIDFRIQPEVAACVPQPGSVTDDAVISALLFLTDQWLVDVRTDFAGKGTIIAAALTLIERSLLDQRPAFWSPPDAVVAVRLRPWSC